MTYFIAHIVNSLNRALPFLCRHSHHVQGQYAAMLAPEKGAIWNIKNEAPRLLAARLKQNALITSDARSFTSFTQTFTIDSSIHTMWYNIRSNLTDLQEQHVPSKFTTTRFHQPWITTEINRITRRKQRAYNICKNKPTTSRERRKYRELQKQTKQLCKSAYI